MDKVRRPLTAKQQAFVAHFLEDLNATQAALRAGYSAKTARAIGCENLTKPRIQAAIQKAMAVRSKRTEITADDVLRRLEREADAGDETEPNSARIRAIELIGKHLQMFVDRHEHKHSGEIGPRDVRITLVKPDGTEETETRKDGKAGA